MRRPGDTVRAALEALGPNLKRRLRVLGGAAVIVGLGGLLPGHSAAAQTLQEALAQAYLNNPTLDAERAELRATDELVPQALSGWRPSLEAAGEFGVERSDSRAVSGGEATSTRQPGSVQLSIVQPLYRGGRTVASTNRAENLVQAQRGTVLSTEQQVLLDAATAYLDVVRDQAVLELNVNNEQVLSRQLQANRDRFEVGEITRTDVSQAESRLAGSIASRIQAEGLLSASRAVYTRIIGSPPGSLEAPTPTFTLPSSLEEAIELALANNPNVVSAEFAEAAARDSIDVVRGEQFPEASLRGDLTRSWEPTSTISRSDGAALTAQIRVPLYQSGAVSSRVREARQIANQRRIEIEETRRAVRENAIRAWVALKTAQASIDSRRSQVRAAEIALEGVRQEAAVGARTTLDTLDAEQELLDARVNLVQAQRDEIVAAFQVLTATGQLTAQQLQLPVDYYEFDEHYRNVRHKW